MLQWRCATFAGTAREGGCRGGGRADGRRMGAPHVLDGSLRFSSLRSSPSNACPFLAFRLPSHQDNGLKSCLVLSGVTSEEKLLSKANTVAPDFYCDDITKFFS